MKFNRDKCQVLHLGKRKQMHSYKIGDTWLSKTTNEKDLGIVVDHKLNMSQQWIHLIVVPSIPLLASLLIRRSWGTLSKALLKSRYIMSTAFPQSTREVT